MKEKITSFIASATYIDANFIKDDTLIFEEGIFDSMGLLGLINFIETEFGIVTNDSELDESNFGSVERIVSFIQRKTVLAS